MADLFPLRQPPANLQAEQALLGALLANNAAYDRVAEFLRPEHFADGVHGVIYEAIAHRIEARQVADAITLKGDLENTGQLDEVGGTAYLGQLLVAMVGIINAADYGHAIRDAWVRRELIAAGTDLVNLAYAPGDHSVQEILDAHDARLLRIAEGAGDVAPAVPMGDAVARALVMAEAASKRASPLAGITTGYAALDRLTLGLQEEQMVLLAARPAMGKTGLGLGIGIRSAAAGSHVLYWTGEMSARQLGARGASAHSGLPTQSVFTARRWPDPSEEVAEDAGKPRLLDATEWDRLVKAEIGARRLPLLIDDRPGLTVQALRARARKLKRAGKLDLVIADYLGLMGRDREIAARPLYEQITAISARLKALAMELHVPVLVLVQLSRAVESRENHLPQLSDLRDSGAIEQDADVVMFLHREHYYLKREKPPAKAARETAAEYQDRLDLFSARLADTEHQATVSLAKNRNGATGIARLRWDGPTTWFRDESEPENSPAWAFPPSES